MFVRIIREIHRVLGVVLGTLFFVWFVSGLVMVYHTFPRVTSEDRLERYDDLADAVDGAAAFSLPKGAKTPLTLNSYMGKLRVNGRVLGGASGGASQDVMSVARLWGGGEDILRIDTLSRLDQWIPFERNLSLMPIYKFYFDGEQQHQLYVASGSGDVLQYTSRRERFWAWLGAIPHWVYFTRLRQDTSLWVSVVVWLAALGCVMCVAGIFMSLRDAIKSRRVVPFRKFWFRWHHILGLVFGVVALLFAFSGMMSLANISGWLPKATMEVSPQRTLRRGVDIESTFGESYGDVLQRYGGAKELEWAAVAGIPYYVVRMDGETIYLDGRRDGGSGSLAPLALSQEECVDIVRSVHGASAELQVSYMTEYDRYYVGRKGRYALPVWRVEVVGDADHSLYFIDPATARVSYVNNTSRVRHWLYPALHSLRFVWLVERPLLWSVVMWLCMVGGAALSITGVWLSVKYLLRLLRRRRGTKS